MQWILCIYAKQFLVLSVINTQFYEILVWLIFWWIREFQYATRITWSFSVDNRKKVTSVSEIIPPEKGDNSNRTSKLCHASRIPQIGNTCRNVSQSGITGASLRVPKIRKFLSIRIVYTLLIHFIVKYWLNVLMFWM